MAHRSENGSEKKMAEGGNDAELLKEKANKYFKGKFDRYVKSVVFYQLFTKDKNVATNYSRDIIVLKHAPNGAGC